MDHAETRQPVPELMAQVMPQAMRGACMGAGDWAVLAAAEVDRVLTQERNRRPEAFARGLKDLVARGAITAADEGVLLEMLKHLFAAVRGKGERPANLAGVLDAYRRLCAARETSPAALAIASTAVRAMEGWAPAAPRSAAEAEGVSAAAINTGAAVTFGVGGALLGAGIGAGFGGPIGAGLGAIIGAAVGAGTSISNDKGV